MRFSILALLGMVTFSAIGIAGLSNPSFLWAGVLRTLIVTMLCMGVVAAIMLREHRQAFWIGFVAAGLSYQYLCTMEDAPPALGSTHAMLGQLAVAMEIDNLDEELYYSETMSKPFTVERLVHSIMQSLFQVMLAFTGGSFAMYCYAKRELDRLRPLKRPHHRTHAADQHPDSARVDDGLAGHHRPSVPLQSS